MLSEIKSQHLSVCLLPTNSHLVQRHTTWDDECDTNFLIQFSEKKRLSTFPSNLLSSTAGGGWCEERKGSSESENTGKGKSVFVSESQIPGSQGCHSLSTRVPGKRFDMPQLIRSPFFFDALRISKWDLGCRCYLLMQHRSQREGNKEEQLLSFNRIS